MASKKVIQAIKQVFLDEYFIAERSDLSADDSNLSIDAIATATAVAIAKAFELHSKTSHQR